MYVDKQEEFSDSQLLTITAISTNVIDLTQGVTSPATLTLIDIGTGEDVYLVIQVDVALTSAGATTCTFTLESDSTADLATSPTVHYTSAAIPKATLVAGYEVLKLKLPAGSYERYLGVRYTVATGPFTGGSVSAFLTNDVQAQTNYPVGFSVG